MENLWVLLALISALLLATSDALSKKALVAHDEYVIAWLRLLLSLPLLLACLPFVEVPRLDKEFYTAFLTALPLEVAALILYTKALKTSPLSLTLPFLSLTPVFLIIIPFILLGEKISLAGAAGVLCIAAGGYTLNIGKFRESVWAPFIAIRKEKGALYMIIVALIYSFTSVLGKSAIGHSSALFFAITYYIVLFLVFTPVALYKSGREMRRVLSSGAVRAMVLPGILDAVMNITHMTAMGLTKVAYMISVKRLSLLIGVYFGYLFFKETGIRERLLGTALMLTGFVLIVVFR
jgi:drug/metabolite transporter (DMT)-like permease